MTRTVKAVLMTSAIAAIVGIFCFAYVQVQNGMVGTGTWGHLGMAAIITILVSVIVAVAVGLIWCGLDWVMEDDGEVERVKAEQQTVKRMLEMGTESLNPDSYTDLERIVGELRHARKFLEED